jgi:CBS domain-containing protein
MKNFNKYLIQETSTTNHAVELIQLNHERIVFVINAKSRVIGTITEGDVMRSILRNNSINTKITAVMNKSFKFLLKEDKNEAKKLIKKFGITVVPVLTKNFILKSLIKIRDLI